MLQILTHSMVMWWFEHCACNHKSVGLTPHHSTFHCMVLYWPKGSNALAGKVTTGLMSHKPCTAPCTPTDGLIGLREVCRHPPCFSKQYSGYDGFNLLTLGPCNFGLQHLLDWIVLKMRILTPATILKIFLRQMDVVCSRGKCSYFSACIKSGSFRCWRGCYDHCKYMYYVKSIWQETHVACRTRYSMPFLQNFFIIYVSWITGTAMTHWWN